MYSRKDPIIGRTYAALEPSFAAIRETFVSPTQETIAARREAVLSFFPDALRTPRAFLSVRSEEAFRCEDYVIERLCMTDADGCPISANLYLPEKKNGKVPAILLPVGHYDDGKTMPEYRIMAETLAKMGCAALIFDPPGQGERAIMIDPAEAARQKDLWCVAQHMYWGDLCYLNGANFSWVMIDELLSAVHYLATREDVDASRIGAIGQSGGGTAVQYLATLSGELSLAIPIHCTSNYEIMLDIHGVGDCEQSLAEYVGKGFDFADYYLPFKDRPLLFIAGDKDFFPYAGVVDTYERLQACGANVQLYTAKGGHVISEEVRAAAYRFVSETFGIPMTEEVTSLCPTEPLLVFTPEERETARRTLFKKSMRWTKPGASPFSDAYADHVSVCGDVLQIDGSLATVSAQARFRAGTSGTLCAHFGVTSEEADALFAAAGEDAVLAVIFDGEEAYRQSAGKGYDDDAIYFYLNVLSGTSVGAQRVMQGMKALTEVQRMLTPSRVLCFGTGSGALTALYARRQLACVTSVSITGGIHDVLHAYQGEETPYRRSDIIPDLFSAISCEELTALACAAERR